MFALISFTSCEGARRSWISILIFVQIAVKLKSYRIDHKVRSLLQYVDHEGRHSFEIDGLTYSMWGSTWEENRKNPDWLVSGDVSAKTGLEAINIFRKSIRRSLARLSFLGQAYIEYADQSFLVRRVDPACDEGLFYNSKSKKVVPMSFLSSQKGSLDDLLKDKEIPDEFFAYWKDATNTPGYSGKVMLMLSAIEALVKGLQRSSGLDKRSQTDLILGEILRKEIWGDGGDQDALRNRLVHGDYFPASDNDYVSILHNKLIHYFNERYSWNPKISEGVVSPQRHYFGNFEYWFGFLASKQRELNIRDVLDDFEKNGINELRRHSIISGDAVAELKKTF